MLPKGSEISNEVSASRPTTKIMGLGDIVGCFWVKGACVLGEWEGVGYV